MQYFQQLDPMEFNQEKLRGEHIRDLLSSTRASTAEYESWSGLRQSCRTNRKVHDRSRAHHHRPQAGRRFGLRRRQLDGCYGPGLRQAARIVGSCEDRTSASSLGRACWRPNLGGPCVVGPRSAHDLAVRVEPARAVLSELVHASRRERSYHALAAQATRHEKHAPRFAPEADQVASVDEDPARLG